MKFVVLGILAVVGTGFAFANSLARFNKTTSESLPVQSNSVSGNIVETRLNNDSQAKPVKLNKNVAKINVDPSRVLYLNDQVVFPVVQDLTNKLKKLQQASNEPIYLLIDSPGGSIIDGATLISEMEASKAPVYTVCTRLCASMAAMIHSYGAKRYQLDRTFLMFHPASAGVGGQVPNMMSQLTTITRYIDKMVAHVTSSSKVDPETYSKLVAYEIWIDSEDAVAKGLSDGIVNLSVPSYEQKAEPAVTTEEAPPEEQKFNSFQWIYPNLSLWKHEVSNKKVAKK